MDSVFAIFASIDRHIPLQWLAVCVAAIVGAVLARRGFLGETTESEATVGVVGAGLVCFIFGSIGPILGICGSTAWIELFTLKVLGEGMCRSSLFFGFHVAWLCAALLLIWRAFVFLFRERG